MKVIISDRGFEFLEHPRYLEPHDDCRLASQSSAIGDYPDSMARPGSSFLWIGKDHHLNREQVARLITHLQQWMYSGSLELDEGE